MLLLTRLRALGFTLRTDGSVLTVQPASRLKDSIRSQIKQQKGELLRALAEEEQALRDPIPDLRHEYAQALRCGRLVVCVACQHFESRASARPDGWCWHLSTETWSNAPFRCELYRARPDVDPVTCGVAVTGAAGTKRERRPYVRMGKSHV